MQKVEVRTMAKAEQRVGYGRKGRGFPCLVDTVHNVQPNVVGK